jgi:hypothetical protein
MIDLLELIYGEKAQQWAKELDDRKLFSNIYYMLLEALQIADTIDNAFIRTAIMAKFKEERAVMDKILERFEGKQEE